MFKLKEVFDRWVVAGTCGGANVGDAAPFLANIEKKIGELALGNSRATAVANALIGLTDDVDNLRSRAVQASDFGSPEDAVEEPPVLEGAVGLGDLERLLLNNPLAGPLFSKTGILGVYNLTLPTTPDSYSLAEPTGTHSPINYADPQGPMIKVTFNREAEDDAEEAVILLTYGAPELAALLPEMRTT